MAKKASVELQVLLKSAGIEATTKQVEKLQENLKETAMANAKSGKEMKKTAKAAKEQTAATKNLTKAQNQQKRAAEGVSARSNREGKDNARMMQGMGGLVGVYATIVGNVYALSTAFLVLRNAADLSSMIKSSEDFSNRFGRSVTTITEDIQKATGGALSFAEALPSINKAIAGGFSTEKITQLSIAATKASQTFGGTANEALSRFISAAQRGRTEIVQTLGIVIQTEKVYEGYAAGIGKAKDELNAFDKQQAIVNAIIAESQSVFEGVNIDPNPFTQFANTVVDVKDNLLTAITDGFTPFISLINKSQGVAIAFMGAVAGMLVKKLLPAVQQMTESAAQAGLESSRQAAKGVRMAREAAKEAAVEAAKTRKRYSLRSNKSDFNRLKKKYATQLATHQAFNKDLYDADEKLNTKRLGQINSAMAREAKLRESGTMKGRQKAFQGMSDSEFSRLRTYYKQLGAGAFKTKKANQEASKAVDDLGNRFTYMWKKGVAAYKGLSAAQTGFKSQLKSGFAQVFETGQTDFTSATKSVGAGWKSFARAFSTSTVSMRHAYKKFGAAIGKTSALVASGFTRLANHLGTIMLVVTVGIALWEKYGDAIRGITPAMREFLDIQEALPERLKAVEDRTNRYLENLKGKTPSTMKELGAALDFATGSFQTINEELNNFTAAFKTAMGAASVKEAELSVEKLEADLKEVNRKAMEWNQRSDLPMRLKWEGFEEFVRQRKDIENQIKGAKNTLDNFGDNLSIEKVANAFAGVSKQADIAGINTSKIILEIEKALSDESTFKGLGEAALKSIATAIAGGNTTEIRDALKGALGKDIYESISPEQLERFIKAARDGSGVLMSLAGGLNASQKGVFDLNTEADKFFLNWERSLFAKGSGNKEFNKLIYNIRGRIQELGETSKDADLAREVVTDPAALQEMKALLGFRRDATITWLELEERSIQKANRVLDIQRNTIALERDKARLKVEERGLQQKTEKYEYNRLANLKQGQAIAVSNLANEKLLMNEKIRNIEDLKELAQQRYDDPKVQGQDKAEAKNEIENQQNLLDLAKAEADIIVETIKNLIFRQDIETDLFSLNEKRILLSTQLNKIEGKLAVSKEKLITSDSVALSNLKEQNNLTLVAAKKQLELKKNAKETTKKNMELTDTKQEQLATDQAAIDLEKQRIANLLITTAIQERLLVISQLRAENTTQLTEAQERAKTINAEIIRSDEGRIRNLEKRHTAEEAILVIKLRDLALQRAGIIAGTIDVDNAERALRAIEAQITASAELLGIKKELNANEQLAEPFRLAQDILKSQKQQLGIQKEINDLVFKQSYVMGGVAQHAQDTLNSLDAQYSKERGILELQKEILDATMTNGDAKRRELKTIDLQLGKLKAKYEIEREIADLNARATAREAKGSASAGIFTKEGIDNIFQYFELKARQAAQALVPLYKTIGDGFYDTITSTFETAINNLLEGGKDFAVTVREAFKAGLREMVSSALLNNMKKIFALAAADFSTFLSKWSNRKTDDGGRAAQEAAERIAEQQSATKQSVENLTARVGDVELKDNANRSLIDYLPRILAAIGGEGSGPPPIGGNKKAGPFGPQMSPIANAPATSLSSVFNPTPAGPSSPVAGGGNKQLIDTLKGGIDVEVGNSLEVDKVGSVIDAPSTGVALGILGSVIAASQGDSKTAIISALFAIAAQIIASQQAAAAAASAGSSLGGTIPGGLLGLANGGVVNRPSVAIIGEGKNNEAVVPLPNNREIPVNLNGAGAGGDTVNIEQNFDFSNADTGSVAQLRTEARAIEDRTFNRVFNEINKGGKYAKYVGRR